MERKNEIKLIQIWFVLTLIFLILIIINSLCIFLTTNNTTNLILNSTIILISMVLLSTGIYIINLIKTKILDDNKLLLRLRNYYSTQLKRKEDELKERENKFNLIFKSALKRSEELNDIKLKLNDIHQRELKKSFKKKTQSRR